MGPAPETPGLQDLLARFRAGKAPALARAITWVENQRDGYQDLLHQVLQAGPRTRRIGLTGPPGAGKSSLVAALAGAHRQAGERLGVVAVDPTSPYSGGALLGDRIRMNELATDPGIFIRSMATRGSLGGLASTTKEVIDLMDAFGFDRVLVETVGVGQTELEITGAADTVVVVLVPESGDAVQAMKAGLMEIADVFVVNKADRPGAERLLKEIRQAIHLRTGSALRDVPAHHGVDLARVMRKEREEEAPAPEGAWTIPVLKTVAQSGEGVSDLLDAVERHGAWLARSGELERRRRARARVRVRDVVDRELRRVAWASSASGAALEAGLDAIVRGDATPYSVARGILTGLLADGGGVAGDR
ncbi:MAG TPA: methylmalonyl Co-A mutase-associated GTPase MeaB [Longimicrobiales bacterium]|nr:methylmalonyl Co-A mutase-associated GTPase MeaB [Longimicrobiales bacterium]